MPPYNLHWHGMLTTGNAEHVAKLLKLLLTRKRFAYTFVRPTWVPESVEVIAHVNTRVEVYTRQRLVTQGGRSRLKIAPVFVEVEDDRAMISVRTTEYLCMYDTRLTGQGAPYDYTHKNPYFSFEGDRVTIKWQTPCGDAAVDVFTLEVR